MPLFIHQSSLPISESPESTVRLWFETKLNLSLFQAVKIVLSQKFSGSEGNDTESGSGHD